MLANAKSLNFLEVAHFKTQRSFIRILKSRNLCEFLAVKLNDFAPVKYVEDMYMVIASYTHQRLPSCNGFLSVEAEMKSGFMLRFKLRASATWIYSHQ